MQKEREGTRERNFEVTLFSHPLNKSTWQKVTVTIVHSLTRIYPGVHHHSDTDNRFWKFPLSKDVGRPPLSILFKLPQRAVSSMEFEGEHYRTDARLNPGGLPLISTRVDGGCCGG